MFRNYMLDGHLIGPDTPHRRLRSICRGYIGFAVDNPALFELVFSFDAKASEQGWISLLPGAERNLPASCCRWP